MWLAIVFIAAYFLLSSVAPKPKVEDARSQGFGENAFPKSQYGDVVPILFGTCEQKSPIVSWYGHLSPRAEYQEVSTGLFSSDTVISGYRYLVGFDLAICLGPNVILKQIKSEGALVWGGGVAEAGASGMEVISIQGISGMGGSIEWHPGNFDQAASPYMTSPSGTGGAHWSQGASVIPCPRYKGIAHATFVEFYVGNNAPTPKPYSFVVQRLTSNLSASYSIMGDDLNPMEIVYTLLTENWGMLGLSSATIDVANFQAAAQVLYNEGLSMSILIGSETTGKAVLEECMRVADAVLYQEPTTGLITVKLIRQDYTVGLLPVFDESNVIGDLENLGKTTWEATFNQARVSFISRDMEYDTQIAVAQDFANINDQGKIKSTTISMPGVKKPSVASILVQRQLSMIGVPFFKCSLKANRSARALRPGSVFVLNWGEYGLSTLVMRVTDIDLGRIVNNEISITCVQDRFSAGLPTFSDPGGSGHIPVGTTPERTTDFWIWEPPSFLVGNVETITQADLNMMNTKSKFMISAKAPSAGSTAFDVHLGPTSAVPAVALQQAPYYGKGILVSDYDNTVAADDGIETSSTLIISGIDSRTYASLVDNATFELARYGSSMFLIDNELFAYVGFTDLGSGQVQFDTVYRGLLDTVIANHIAGASVWFIYRGSGVIPVDVDYGNLTYFKVLDRTPTLKYPLEDATAVNNTLTGRAKRPLPPQYITIDGSRTPPTKVSATSITVDWLRRSRLSPKLVAFNEVYDGAYDTFGNISHIVNYSLDAVPTGSFFVDDIGPSTVVNTYDIDVTGMVGTLLVEVFAVDNINGESSLVAATIEVELT